MIWSGVIKNVKDQEIADMNAIENAIIVSLSILMIAKLKSIENQTVGTITNTCVMKYQIPLMKLNAINSVEEPLNVVMIAKNYVNLTVNLSMKI